MKLTNLSTLKQLVSREPPTYVGWNSYKKKIDFLSEFYHEQAHLRNKLST